MVIHAHQASVADGHAMGVAAEVAKNLLGTAEGPLGIDDPACLVQALSAATGGAIWHLVVQLALAQKLFQAGHELATKERTHDMDGKEKVARRRYPLALVARETAAGDDAMDVRVKPQIPGPRMQHGGDAKLCTLSEPLRVGRQGQERVGGSAEQEGEDRGSVVAGEAVQLAGDGEHEVKVVDGQDALEAGLDPAGLVERLTLGAVAISARVVGGRLETAGGAEVEMAAERGRPTRDDGVCNVVLARGQGVDLAIVVEVAAKDIRHLELGTRHLPTRRASGMR